MAKNTVAKEPKEKAPSAKKQSATAQLQHGDGNTTELQIDEIPFIPGPRSMDAQENNGNLPAKLTAEQQGQEAIKKFDIARSWIAEKKAEFKDYKIDGLEDKEGYKKVHAAWQLIRSKRIAVGKKRQELKADLLVVGRIIDGEGNGLGTDLEEIEDPLKAELDRIDGLKEAEKLERMRLENERVQNRVRQLIENGIKFDGAFYSIGETISMDIVTLKELPDEKYLSLLERVKDENGRIQKIAQELEAKRIADEQRLKDEADKLEKQRLAQEQQQKDLDAKLQKLKEATTKARSGRLAGLGMIYNHSGWFFQFGTLDHGHVILHRDDVENLEDDRFDEKFNELDATVKEMKEKQAATDLVKEQDKKAAAAEQARIQLEKEAKDQQTAARKGELRGMALRDTMADGFERSPRYPELSSRVFISYIDIADAGPERWEEILQVSKVKIGELVAAELKEDERLEAEEEKERRAGLSDAEQIREYLQAVGEAFAVPLSIKSKTLKPALTIFTNRVQMEIDKLAELVRIKK